MRDPIVSVRGLTRSRWAAFGAAVAVTLGGGGLVVTQAASNNGQRNVFVPITPCRLFDTRPGTLVGARNTPIGNGETMLQAVTGTNGNCVLPGDATAVAMNVTSVNGTAASYLTIWPSDTSLPLASSLNWIPGSPPTPNKVDVKLSATGTISLFNSSGTVDVLADVVGYYTDHNHDDRYFTEDEVTTKLASKADTAHNHDDRYYTKAKIDAKLPASGVVTIASPAFQATDTRAYTFTDTSGCSTNDGGHGATSTTTLDASVQLPVGVKITSVTVVIGNVPFLNGVSGGGATLYRRTVSGVTALASLDSFGLSAGLHSRTTALAAPELVTSGNYYFIRFSAALLGLGIGVSVCGAEIAYTTPG